MAFYAGWPKAWAALRLAKEVWADETTASDDSSAFEQEMFFPIGQPNDAFAEYLRDKVISQLCPILRYLSVMLPLSRDVAIIGIYIMQTRVEDRFLSVWQAKVGIRNGVNRHVNCCRVMSSIFRWASNIGMVLPLTAGSLISP